MIENVYGVAKRHNNKRRAYLLVNRLQGKHVPTSPMGALDMAQKLGEKLKKLEGKSMVIAFAETATAIGAAAAEVMGSEVFFINTTREPLTDVHCIEFLEEHSHAREQSLVAEKLEKEIGKSDNVIFLDDELSTGKTMSNIIRKLKERYSVLNGKKLIVASLLNRVSEENSQKLKSMGIYEVYLWKTEEDNYEEYAEGLTTTVAVRPNVTGDVKTFEKIKINKMGLNPRLGFKIGEYVSKCKEINEKIIRDYGEVIKSGERILVLGTEECMYPALSLGAAIEKKFEGVKVFSHATTRSPIGISDAPEYPIKMGYKIPSFYEESRMTYIYNVEKYDIVFVVTDAPSPSDKALKVLASVFGEAKRLFLVEVS